MDLDAIKAATWDLHMRAERSGIIADILARRASRFGVALLLRNLLPVYQVLDASVFGHPALARSAAIEADLLALAPDVALPLLPQGAAYAEQVLGAGDGLAGHAYVRYLGDLNGGRVMRRRLGEIGALMTFHDYPGLGDHAAFTQDYRKVLDQAMQAAPFEAIKREALAGFEMNIALSEAVKRIVVERHETVKAP